MWLMLGAAGIATFGAWIVRNRLGLELSNTFRTFHGMKAVVTSVFDVVTSLDNLARMWSGQERLPASPVRTQGSWVSPQAYTPPRTYPVYTPPSPAPRQGVEVGAALATFNNQVLRPAFVSPNVSIDDAPPDDIPGIIKYGLRDWTKEEVRAWSQDYLVTEAHDSGVAWHLALRDEANCESSFDPGYEELAKEVGRAKDAHFDAQLLIRHFNEACQARDWLDLVIKDRDWEVTEEDLDKVLTNTH